MTSSNDGICFPKGRRAAIVLLLLIQTGYFFAFGQWPPTVIADNTRYDEPALNLANGRGLSIRYESLKDPTLRDAACTRDPSACHDDLYPTASYPPGYQFFLAGVFWIAGHHLVVVEALQWLLLMAMFVLFEVMANALLGRVGYLFAMLVACAYPFLARQASVIMGDHLHAALLLGGLGVLSLDKPGHRRGVLVGALLGLSTFTRPYSLFAALGIIAFPLARRNLNLSIREALLFLLAFVGPFIPWTVRNLVVFGKFIPLSASGIGYSLFLNELEAKNGAAIDPAAQLLINERSAQLGEYLAVDVNQRLTVEGFKWIAGDPLGFLGLLPMRALRVWVSLGYSGQGYSKAVIVLAAFLGGLLLLGVVGMILRASRGPWTAIAVVIVLYWAFLLISPGEARRTLPLRLPMLLFAAAAVEHWCGRFRARRAVVKTDTIQSGIYPAELD